MLRMDVFTELHTAAQFDGDSKPVLPIILAGQNNLTDNLMFRQSRPLASRVVARGHMKALKSNEMARGALMAAAAEKCQIVAAEHVCMASTEII